MQSSSQYKGMSIVAKVNGAQPLTRISHNHVINVITDTNRVTPTKSGIPVRIRINMKDRPRKVTTIGTKLRNQTMIAARSRVTLISRGISVRTLAINMMVGLTNKLTKAGIRRKPASRTIEIKRKRRQSKMRWKRNPNRCCGTKLKNSTRKNSISLKLLCLLCMAPDYAYCILQVIM